MSSDTDHLEAAERGLVTRAVEVVLDPSPSQQRWLRSYVGSMRAAYNWALAEVRDNLDVRRAERDRGVPEDELTPALSWSRESLTARWRQLGATSHPPEGAAGCRPGPPFGGRLDPHPAAGCGP